MKAKEFKFNFKRRMAGFNSEWVRHYVQNVFAHGWARPQRMFEMLSNDWKTVNQQGLGTNKNKFSLW